MSPPNNTTAFDVKSATVNQSNDHIRNDDEQFEQQPEHQRKQQLDWEGPPAQGLYDPANEHEACGVGFIVAIDGKRSHKVSLKCLQLLTCRLGKLTSGFIATVYMERKKMGGKWVVLKKLQCICFVSVWW